MRKPTEQIEPDERWHWMHGDRDALEQIAEAWAAPGAPKPVAEMLRVGRQLFIHSYFVFEFGVVAVMWCLIAVEAALRDCLGVEARERDGLRALITKAQRRGWLTEGEVDDLISTAKLRNALAHADSQWVLPIGATAPMLEHAHETIAALYLRSARAEEQINA